MKNYFKNSASLILISGLALISPAQEKYQGKPWQGVIQQIPGKIQCEFYDKGGEGISYHDQDSINNGSGKLNPADGSFLNEFRMNEGVDISYTKFREPAIDNSPYNFFEPEKDQLYVGWTNPGEWINYTINVKEAGTYQLGIMYTSNQNGEISLSINHKDATGPIKIPSTFVAEDSVAWRQWHHWNYLDNAGQITLKKGIQIITLNTVKIGQMNYDFINFKRIE